MPRMEDKIYTWFDYPDDPDKAKVEICNLTDEEVEAVRAKATITRNYMGDDGTPQREQLIDLAVDRRETVLLAVRNWENFYDEKGQPMKCSPEALSRWSCNATFVNFINSKLPLQAEAARAEAEERRKNS